VLKTNEIYHRELKFPCVAASAAITTRNAALKCFTNKKHYNKHENQSKNIINLKSDYI